VRIIRAERSASLASPVGLAQAFTHDDFLAGGGRIELYCAVHNMHNASRKFGRRGDCYRNPFHQFYVGAGRVSQTLAAIKRGSISNR